MFKDNMTYIKWKCPYCREEVISNSKRRHEMNICKCGKTGCDLEEDYCRWVGIPEWVKEYDYNFFDELVIGLEKQGIIKLIPQSRRGVLSLYISLEDVIFIRKLEDEIVESLK